MSKREMFSKYREYSFMTFLGGLFEIKFYNVFREPYKKMSKREMFSKYQEYSFMTFLGRIFCNKIL